MQGTTGSTFSPDRASNRGMIAAILYRLEGRPRAGTPPFTDVAADSYCADAGAWAEQQGIVRGFDDGTFRPEGRITRQQLAAILFRYTEYRGADTAGRTDLSRFSDSAAVADYAREALAWAVSAGLLQGRSDGTLNPSGSATRAQTAVILQRLETLLEKN